MKLLTSLAITIAIVAPVLAQTPTPSTEAQVQQELNEAARMFREGNFTQAQAHSERALLLDPQNKVAPVFVARTIHALYKPGDFTTDNVAKAREAIVAYQRILMRVPTDDEAYKAVEYLYGAIKDEQLLRQWVWQRAVDASIANDKRADAYVVLASKDWQCSYDVTEAQGNKVAVIKGTKATTHYRMPKDRATFEQAQECANRALEMANMAVILTPESESAWSYKANILFELAKLAEMSRDLPQRKELLRQYEAAYNETTRLSNRAQSKP